MKKISQIILMVMSLSVTSLWAQKVNVISKYAESEIFIDGKYVANKAVYDYQVEAGTHVIQVEKNGQVYLRKAVDVAPDTVQTIYAEDFVNVPQTATRIPDRGAKDLEASRVRESRGKIGVGLHLSSGASGLSGKYFFTPQWGAQLVGWSGSSQEQDYSSFGYRVIYNLVDTMAKDNIVSLYLAAGAGVTSNNDKGGFSFLNKRAEMQEVVLGIEIPSDGILQNLSYSIEVGAENLNVDGVKTNGGFKFNAGAHFYF